MAEPPVTFAGLLRELRVHAQLTQEELAEVSGVRPRTVSDLERGVATTPQRETIRRLADALSLSGKARAQFEAIARGREIPAVADGPTAATRTLPRDVASFTGRQQELLELISVAADAAGSGGVVSIHAIGGMAGVGKTAFAVHAAHRLADRFPAGQIFLPLHGHTPGHAPVAPADALADLLTTLGVSASQIPAGLEARMALWRNRIAESQLLLILDDATSSEQVLPLLPSGGSLVLVTSRRHLSALNDAIAISLDILPPGEAAALLVRLAGRPGLSVDDSALAEIARLCGYLPLAIGMVARQLHHHPAWTPAGRAAELAAAVDRLEMMETENLSVAAAFNLSYEVLTPDQQRLFRRLGLHPGTDIDAYAAAALDSTGLAAARRGLEVLYDQYLIAELAQGRYRMHDLIGAHARALAESLDTNDDREQATSRLLDYYQHAAARAEALIAHRTRPGTPQPDTLMRAAVPVLNSREQALAWARAERVSLLACLDHSIGTGLDTRIVALAAGVAGLLRRDGPWAHAVSCHAAAVNAAQRLGDRIGQANALDDLAAIQRLTDSFPAAAQSLEQALDIYRDIGERLGQANTLNSLGVVQMAAGDFPAAVKSQKQAMDIYRHIGDRRGEANTLIDLGEAWSVTDEYPVAAQAQMQALTIYRDIGDRIGEAGALRHLGVGRLVTGDFSAAAPLLEQALDIYREHSDQLGQANTLLPLGDVLTVTGDYPAATEVLEQGLDIFREFGNRLGQANTLTNLGTVRGLTGEYPAAAQALEQALGIYLDIGERLGLANALTALGTVRRETNNYPAAAEVLGQALDIYRDLGDRGGEVTALNEIGTLYCAGGKLAQAERCHQQALELAHALGSAWDEAHGLAGLGRCFKAAGHITQAENLLRQALEIFQRISAAEVPNLLAELDTLTSPAPGQ